MIPTRNRNTIKLANYTVEQSPKYGTFLEIKICRASPIEELPPGDLPPPKIQISNFFLHKNYRELSFKLKKLFAAVTNVTKLDFLHSYEYKSLKKNFERLKRL